MGFGISFGFGPFRVWASAPRRRRTIRWTHPGCQVRHRTQAAADQCALQLRARYEHTEDGTVTITRSTPAGGDPPQTFRDLRIGIRSEVAKPVPHCRLG
jgi:hypothetical protein